ncbi:MAG: hypothetical protein K0R26_1903 [Bacteroidota bacterium]|jgi:hypothetical protein|nr:hypothetical protein [Bacteroidota bacterium]
MGPYKSEDIRQMVTDLIAALTSITPGQGIGVGGVDTKAYKTTVNDGELELTDVLSFCVSNSGTEPGYFTHDLLDNPANRQVIDVDDNLPFGGSINFFSYIKFSATNLATELTVTYIKRA